MTSLLFVELTSVVTAGLGFAVWLRNRRTPTHVYFLMFAFSVAGWNSANGFVHFFANSSFGFLWGRLTFFFASLVALTLFLLVVEFPAPRAQVFPIPSVRLLWIAAGALFACASFTPLILVHTSSVHSALTVNYGPLHVPFAVYFVSCIVSSLLLLNQKRRCLSGTDRIHSQYLLAAVLAPVIGASATNLLLPITLRISRYGQYAALFTLLLVIQMTHAIIRHRLMDIRLVIRRSAVYAAALLGAASLLLLMLAIGAEFAGEQASLMTTALFVLPVALLFHPLKTGIQYALDVYLCREPYNYQSVVRTTSRALATTIELKRILSSLGTVVQNVLKPVSARIYLFDAEEDHFVLSWASGELDAPLTITLHPAITAAALARHGPLFRDEFVQSLATDQLIGNELDRAGVHVFVPLIIARDGLVGFLMLGPKRLDNPYFSDDADLLATLANQSAVAVRNAQTHQRVVQMNEELQKILSTIDSGVVAVGGKGKVTLFNRAAEQLTAHQEAEMRGRLVGELPAPLSGLLAATLADSQPRGHVEFTLPDAAGQVRPLICSTAPLLTAEGEARGAVAVIGDLSHLKALEQEKRRAERLASIEAIASGLVHEVRNPLVAIKTFAQLITARYQDPEFRESFSRTADREIRRIDDLLTRFGTLASASSQPMEPVDVTVPMRRTLELLRPQLEQRQIRLRQVADGTPRAIIGNASQLQQLFLNLCLNAVEAMEPGGELTVRVADLADAGGATLIVEVSDTGAGIPDELLPKIFTPFVTTKARGSGLGLAICRGIADSHRARISARNNVGRPGCTVTIEFPVPVPEPSRVTP